MGSQEDVRRPLELGRQLQQDKIASPDTEQVETLETACLYLSFYGGALRGFLLASGLVTVGCHFLLDLKPVCSHFALAWVP